MRLLNVTHLEGTPQERASMFPTDRLTQCADESNEIKHLLLALEAAVSSDYAGEAARNAYGLLAGQLHARLSNVVEELEDLLQAVREAKELDPGLRQALESAPLWKDAARWSPEEEVASMPVEEMSPELREALKDGPLWARNLSDLEEDEAPTGEEPGDAPEKPCEDAA